jgi:hypothetical protein
MSVAKYTMPKEKRFSGNYKRPLCDSIYDLPDLMEKQGTCMGLGNRSDIINRKETESTPSPLNYNYSSIFDDNCKRHKGYSISQKLIYKVNEI